MLTFIVGLLAALLWLGTILGLYLLVKASPRHPFQTIREFRIARKRLAKPSGPIVEVVTPEPPRVEELAPVYVEEQPPPHPQPTDGAPQPAEPRHSGGAVQRYIAQVEWLEAQNAPPVIEIPELEEETAPETRVSNEVRKVHAGRTEPTPPKRVGVVLVDDEGKPQL